MKIFISHKREDDSTAAEVLRVLRSHRVEAYLDLLEGEISLRGEALTNHIKKRLNECTDLLVVMSEKTKDSWWVPFEVGMAAQRDFPIVNYLKAGVMLPDYLAYWPHLKNQNDLFKYVEKIKQRMRVTKAMGQYATADYGTARFYRELKDVL